MTAPDGTHRGNVNRRRPGRGACGTAMDSRILEGTGGQQGGVELKHIDLEGE